MLRCTWKNALAQLEREHIFKGSSRSHKTVSLSVVSKFLTDNIQNLEAEIDANFLHRIEKAVRDDFQPDHGAPLILAKTVDSAYKARINGLLRACKAVTGSEFHEVLRELLDISGMTIPEIAKCAGISAGCLHKLKLNLGLESFPKEALPELDRILKAGGRLVSAFAAIVMPQARQAQILPKLAGQVTFASEFRRAKEQSSLTFRELADQVKVPQPRLSAWQAGINTPTMESKGAVEKLDALMNCGGKLLEVWLASKPLLKNLHGDPYRCVFSEWSQHTQQQWLEFQDYHTKNTNQLDRKNPEPWSEATVHSILRFVEMVFGWLVHAKRFNKEDLSLFLLCEWQYVRGWLDFTRTRTGHAYYSHAQKALIRHYSYWMRQYFALVWREGSADPYWKQKLPAKVVIEIELAPGVGVKRKHEFVLENNEERWAAVIGEAYKKAQKFITLEKFVKGDYTRQVKAFLDSKATVQEIGGILSEAVFELPAKIRSIGTAVHCRRIALCCLLVVRAFRRGTLQRLESGHVSINQGPVTLDCPPEIMKNRKPVKGPLPDVPWIHAMLKRYWLEARPLLLRSQQDKGYFFTSRTGKRLSAGAVYNDAMIILGVNPHAVRYVIATDGHRQDFSDDALAELLGHHPKMTRDIYTKADAEDKNAKANRTAVGLFGRSVAKSRT
jgi:integrase